MPDSPRPVAEGGSAAQAALSAALRSIAPPFVRVGVRRFSVGDIGLLFDAEGDAVHRAVLRRRLEFAAGRVLLRALMQREVAIPVSANRAPSLPCGVRASLAHDDHFVVAALSDDPRVLALGVDIEPATELEPGLAEIIVRHDEAGLDPHLAFTLKEATYKTWSNLGGPVLEHHDVRVLLTGGRSFAAEVVDGGRTFSGIFASAAGRWLALVVEPAPAAGW